jgi:integrase
MIHKIRAHEHYLANKIKGIARWRTPGTVKKTIRRFIEELAMGKVNRGRKICEGRQAKYLDSLRLPLEFFNKPIERLTLADIERFEKALSTDVIQSRQKGKPYALNTKVDIRKAIKVFLRWRLGVIRAQKLAGWLDTRDCFKTPDYLAEAEIERLLKQCRTAEQRFLVAVLFDSGARAEEFINIRLEDIRLPEGQDNFVKLTLKEEYSKTKGRTISLYWRHSLEAVREYVQARIREGLKADDPVFAKHYDAMRMFLHRLGRRVLGRRVHPHLFRHSSATYYAPKLNRQELCYRYGWRFSSNMPDIYISRAGMVSPELDQKFTQTELSTLKDDLARVNQDNQIKTQRIDELQQSLEAMQQSVRMISEVLAANPSIAEVEAAVARKREAQRKKRAI